MAENADRPKAAVDRVHTLRNSCRNLSERTSALNFLRGTMTLADSVGKRPSADVSRPIETLDSAEGARASEAMVLDASPKAGKAAGDAYI